ncbi:MAG: DUF456 domain-containing protein [Cyclobacteriaceae bacterium]
MEIIWTDVLIASVATVLCLVGVLGSFLPVLPGPPVSYLGMLSLQLQEVKPFTTKELVVWFVIIALITGLDYIIPLIGTKRFGGSKYGAWGSTIGIVVGLFLGPIGIVLGPAIGAFIGELIYQRDVNVALKAALGSFIGFLAGTFLKVISCLVLLGLVIWQGFF